MAQARYKKEEADSLDLHFKRRIREGLLIVVSALALFLLLALLSYHTTDPGWSRTALTKHVANIGGVVGAWLSDVLFYIFGYVAYLFPLLLLGSVLKPLWQGKETLFRSGGLVLLLISGSTLSSLYLLSFHMPAGAGGVLGALLSEPMVHVFNEFGAGLIMFALLLCGITLFSGLSWLGILELIGKWTLTILTSIKWPAKREIAIEPKPIKTKKITISKPESPKALFEPMPEGSKPSLSLLDLPDKSASGGIPRDQLEKISQEVELKLQDFNIEARVVAVHPGPVVTRFELQLAAGTKVSKITGLAKDLARSLAVISVRVVEVIPGKPYIGLELPNDNREIVRLREILSSKQYRTAHSPLTLALGKDISGHPVIVDLAKMPHLLVAGTTGSGKSVGINATLLSLLYKYSPNDVRLILIDPKMLELSVYEGIPHLLAPVVTNMKEAANALRWCVAEMERRYKLLASLGVRSIIGYNSKVKDAKKKGAPLLDPLWQADSGEEQSELCELPYIVVVIDEFADMMMVVGKKVEELIARIAQKARAAGIHLILATQRPSVDVITGLIKANIPSRIAFQVSSRVDSRTIIDQMGAEQLLGSGDMLYLPPGTVVPVRVHGAFVADDEVHKVVKDLKKRGQPDYLEEILEGGSDGDQAVLNDDDAEQDPLYDQAVQFILETRRVSISSIQRKFKIGYNRAARIVEAMEAAGLVSPMQSNGGREILVPDSNG